jgi:hypothetical protein
MADIVDILRSEQAVPLDQCDLGLKGADNIHEPPPPLRAPRDHSPLHYFMLEISKYRPAPACKRYFAACLPWMVMAGRG